MLLGGIEAGGTKFICGVGNEKGEVLERISFPTATPTETIAKVIDFYKTQAVDAIGIGSFGPVDLNPSSPTYGYITTTPKPNWGNYNFLGAIKKAFDIPIGFDTDVNVAALGELEWGTAQGLDSCVYITVGTGIGAGLIVEGQLVHGLLHPEVGHVKVARHPEDTLETNCPFHEDCLEGLAAGPAIEKRWGKKGHELKGENQVWEMEAYYLAQAVTNLILTVSPKKVILGGGVMKQQQIFPLLRAQVQQNLNGYIQSKAILEDIDNYIVYPKLGDNAGLCGAFALAKRVR